MVIKTWRDAMEAEVSDGLIVSTTLVQQYMQAEVDELRQENARLRDAIEKAADDIESWGAYASDYFKEKHNLQRDIEAARAALGEK